MVEQVGYALMRLSEPFQKIEPPGGWTKAKPTESDPKCFLSATDAARRLKQPGCNVAIGITSADTFIAESDAPEVTAELEKRAGTAGLQWRTPRGGLAVLLRGRAPKLAEADTGGLGTRTKGHYQLAPGCWVDGRAYPEPEKKPPPPGEPPWPYVLIRRGELEAPPPFLEWLGELEQIQIAERKRKKVERKREKDLAALCAEVESRTEGRNNAVISSVRRGHNAGLLADDESIDTFTRAYARSFGDEAAELEEARKEVEHALETVRSTPSNVLKFRKAAAGAGEALAGFAATAGGRKPKTGPELLADALAPTLNGRHQFDGTRGWMTRTSAGHWREDPQALAVRAAVAPKVVDAIRAGASGGLTAVAVARALEPRLALPHGASWDADPLLAGLPDGRVVALATGEVRPATAADRITLALGAVPEEGETPVFDALLARMLGTDDAIRYVLLWCGYSVTGVVREHTALLFRGSPGCGKSTLLRAISDALGGYAGHIPPDAGQGQHRQWLARLEGRRAVLVPEMAPNIWRSPELKQAMSGESVTANLMRRESRDFVPPAKWCFAANEAPAIGRADVGLFRRLAVIEVPELPADERDPKLPERLAAEYPALAHRFITLAAEYLREGLPAVPSEWRVNLREYSEAQDTLGMWIDETIEHGSHTVGKKVRVGELRKRYLDSHPGARDMPTKAIIERLRRRDLWAPRFSEGERRIYPIRSGQVRVWRNLMLIPADFGESKRMDGSK